MRLLKSASNPPHGKCDRCSTVAASVVLAFQSHLLVSGSREHVNRIVVPTCTYSRCIRNSEELSYLVPVAHFYLDWFLAY